MPFLQRRTPQGAAEKKDDQRISACSSAGCAMNEGLMAKRSKTLTDTATVASCYAAGLQALEQGKVAEARAWADRCSALGDASRDARCAALHGKIAVAMGNFEEAANHFRA